MVLKAPDTELDILLSGVRKSTLLKVHKKKVQEVASFDISFSPVSNMIITNNTMILGLNKVVAVVDICTGKISAYTFISEEAEADIYKAKKIIEEKQFYNRYICE